MTSVAVGSATHVMTRFQHKDFYSIEDLRRLLEDFAALITVCDMTDAQLNSFVEEAGAPLEWREHRVNSLTSFTLNNIMAAAAVVRLTYSSPLEIVIAAVSLSTVFASRFLSLAGRWLEVRQRYAESQAAIQRARFEAEAIEVIREALRERAASQEFDLKDSMDESMKDLIRRASRALVEIEAVEIEQ